MAEGLLQDLPRDLPTFLERFGTDEACRAYLVRARWPEGFGCGGCGHDQAYSHKKRLIEECTACGKQHSILAGTIFEQTKTGLARWFLAIYLVTSSKGGISAMELKRQMGFGSYGTAWAWLHKIRRAMVVPGRQPLGDRVEADETLVGGARPGRPGRGAAGKTVVAGAVESGRGKARGRRLGRLRLQAVRDASASSLAGFLGRTSCAPPPSPRTAGRAIAGSRPRASPTSRSISPVPGATPRSACRRSTSSSGSPNAGSSAPTMVRSAPSTCKPISTSTSSASTDGPPRASPTASPASSSRPSSPNRPPITPSATAAPEPCGELVH